MKYTVFGDGCFIPADEKNKHVSDKEGAADDEYALLYFLKRGIVEAVIANFNKINEIEICVCI